MIRKLIKFFFNWFYKIKPPEMVSYWKNTEMTQAKLIEGKDGSYQMAVKGEKYALPGFPRGHVLNGPVAAIKSKVKNMVFNQVFAELEKMSKDANADMLPPEKMAPAVREFYRVLDLVENAEVVEDMKAR